MKKEDYISLINYGVKIPTCKKGLLELVDKYFRLKKALDKACTELENLSYVKGLGQLGKNYSEWN